MRALRPAQPLEMRLCHGRDPEDIFLASYGSTGSRGVVVEDHGNGSVFLLARLAWGEPLGSSRTVRITLALLLAPPRSYHEVCLFGFRELTEAVATSSVTVLKAATIAYGVVSNHEQLGGTGGAANHSRTAARLLHGVCYCRVIRVGSPTMLAPLSLRRSP